MAYVLVQHLDPSHESILPDLLARDTAAPIVLASDGLAIKEGHVYVIPPNVSMTLADGHLRLRPRREEERPHLPIDEFLISLAEVQQNNAVGIVLSGTGSDGARGIESIKGEGGITFAQEPADARWDSMPRAAIATACVDFIMPAADIGHRLTDIGRHRLMQRPGDKGESTTGHLKSILQALRKHSGVDFSHYKEATVQRRVLRRMVLQRVESIGAYAALVQREPDELDALYNDLLIQVTRFFRDREAFEALQREVFPRIIAAHKPGSCIRVWVPGCSTGEEAYSIAIGLMEALGDDALATSLQIFATDISERSIAKARAALYPESIAADISEERLRRFFVKEDGGAYRVAKLIRDQCVFARHNLTADPPFSQLDLISCRNVLIYLQASLHPRVYNVFHYALKPGGFLLLGSAETAANVPDLFGAVNSSQRIYQRREGRSHPSLLSFGRNLAPRATSPPRRAPSELDVERHADQIVLGSHAPSGVVIDEQNRVLQFRGRTALYLEPPTGSATFDLLKMVRTELLADLRDVLNEARTQGMRASTESMRISGAEHAPVRVEVTPFRLNESDQQYFLVLFEEVEGRPAPTEATLPASGNPDRRIAELQQRLEAYERYGRAIQQEHEAIVHDLRAANEEIESSNEELQSTNEELETAKEELQSVNEELTTLNDELRDRNAELGVLNDDLKNLFANVHIPVILVGNDLRIRRFNSAADRIANLVSTDVGRRLDEIRLHVDAPDLAEQTQFVIDSLEPKEQELKDKSGRWFGMTIRPYRSAGHRIDGAVIVFHDIHAAKQHALALQVASHYFETIVETVRQPLLILDETLRVVTANRAFHERFATTPDEVKGMPLSALGEGEWGNPKLRDLTRKAVEGTNFEDFELTVPDENGRERTLVLSAQRLDFSGTRPPLVLLAIDDVTESKKSRERDHLLSEATAALGSTLNESVLTETVAHIAVPLIADWCFLALVGRDEALVLADSVFHDPAHASEAQKVAFRSLEAPEHPIREVVSTGEPYLLPEISSDSLQKMACDAEHLAELRRLNPHSMMIVPVTASGRTRGALVFVFTKKGRRYSEADLAVATELGRRCGVALEHVELFAATAAARASAEASNKAKKDFLATMSHELRTPLNAILGYTELLELEVQGPLTPDQRRAVERINYSRKHLTHLIDRVLQYAKLESDAQPFHFEPVSVNDLLEEVAAMFDAEVKRNGLSLDVRTSPVPQFVEADAGAMRQIVINVVANALKFTPRGGHVEMMAAGRNGDVEVSIADSGPGIPQDKLDLVFEPFVQLEPRQDRAGMSMGLGLAISRELARKMAGDLTAASTAGHGSTFTLRLPSVGADSPADKASD
jgi:two-component system CheB/CheR fusion protein